MKQRQTSMKYRAQHAQKQQVNNILAKQGWQHPKVAKLFEIIRNLQQQ